MRDDILRKIFTNEEFKTKFKELPSKELNLFDLAKEQERLIAEYSDGYFVQVDPGENHLNDLLHGDLQTIDGEYIDIKIGQGEYAGCINKTSVDRFLGNMYICITGDLNSYYLINPHALKELVEAKKIYAIKSKFGGPDFVGEVGFRKYFPKLSIKQEA